MEGILRLPLRCLFLGGSYFGIVSLCYMKSAAGNAKRNPTMAFDDIRPQFYSIQCAYCLKEPKNTNQSNKVRTEKN